MDRKLRPSGKKLLSLLVVIGVLGWIGLYVQRHWHDFGIIQRLSARDFILLLVLTLLYYLVNALMIRTSVTPMKIRLRFGEAFGVVMTTLLGNYVFPLTGFGFRAVYLKKVYALEYRDFLTTTAAIYVATFTVFTVGGLASLFLLFLRSARVELELAIILSIALLVLGSITVVRLNVPQSDNKYLGRLRDLLNGWNRLRTDRAFVTKLFTLAVLAFFIYALLFFFTFRALGMSCCCTDAFLPACVSMYALVLRLTPASLGLYEGAVIYSSHLLEVTVSQSLLVAALVRIAAICCICTLGPLFSRLLLGQSMKEWRQTV